MPIRRVFEAYLEGHRDLRPFFESWPGDVFANPPPRHSWWPGLAERLAKYQEAIGNEIEWNPAEAVIITGQQPALLGGPLYTVYKIATTVKLAGILAHKHGIGYTPVFWLGADDHDFDEASTAHILTRNHEPLTLTYRPEQDVIGLPMHRVPLEPSLHGLIDQAAEAATGSEFRDEIYSFLHSSLDKSSTFAEWSARIIARLFQGTGLVQIASNLQEARNAAQPVIEEEIRNPLVSTRLVNETGQRLAELGFEQQIVKNENECGFFLEVDGRRRKVLFESGRFVVPANDRRYTQEELRGLLGESPERFSPNVALRCIVQQYLFPVQAYVAGPGEVSYWAQLKPLFEHFGIGMPAVYPRARCILTNAKLNKLREKLRFDLNGALLFPPEALVNDALRATTRNPATEAFRRHRNAIERVLADLASELDKSPVPPSELASRIESDLDWYERSLLHVDEAQVEATRRQVLRLCNTFAPWRKPQERVYTVFSYLFEHGWGLIPRIIRDIDVESFGVDELEL